MVTSLQVRNVEEAYFYGLQLVREEGVREKTRNGLALVVPWPVVTVYERPTERVLLNRGRDANPFFHLMESMWMLAGRNDVRSLEPFNSGLKNYSDDGVRYHGAYGHRWREHWPCDQLQLVIQELRRNPASRRVVLAMWDPECDLGNEGRDFPCNTQVYFRVREGRLLDMTVMCRSNDAIWGAYGANAVHFSVLQEFVAAAIGADVGHLYQWSNNLHAYLDTLEGVGEPSLYWDRTLSHQTSHYEAGVVSASPLFRQSPKMPVGEIFRQVEAFWDGSDEVGRPSDLRDFFTSEGIGDLIMMRAAYRAFKRRDRHGAVSCAESIRSTDWQRACTEWLARRYAAAGERDGAPD